MEDAIMEVCITLPASLPWTLAANGLGWRSAIRWESLHRG